MENYSTLLKLYKGELFSYNIPNKTYADILSKIVNLENNIHNMLKPHQEILDIYNSIDQLFGELTEETSNVYFTNGFKIGLLLAFEILGFTRKED